MKQAKLRDQIKVDNSVNFNQCQQRENKMRTTSMQSSHTVLSGAESASHPVRHARDVIVPIPNPVPIAV